MVSRNYGDFVDGDNRRLSPPFSPVLDRCGFKPSVQCIGTPSMRGFSSRDSQWLPHGYVSLVGLGFHHRPAPRCATAHTYMYTIIPMGLST